MSTKRRKYLNEFQRLPFLTGNNSGIILLVVLWLLIILTVLAVGTGRRTSIDLALARHALGKKQACSYSWAGLIYSVNQIKRDSADDATKRFDTLYQLGAFFDEGESPEELFDRVKMDEISFSVGYDRKEEPQGQRRHFFGIGDEDSKININAITNQNFRVLKNLIELLGYDEEQALTVAYSTIDWKDADDVLINSPYGAENEYYHGQSSPYNCKNKPFDSLEEFLLVRGVDAELFNDIKPYITVFAKNTNHLRVNLNTAPTIVLKALAYAVAGTVTNTDIDDAESLVEKIVAFRLGDDGILASQDDPLVEMNDLGLNAKERAIYSASRGRFSSDSSFLRISSKGIDRTSGAVCSAEVVINRKDLTVQYWHRN